MVHNFVHFLLSVPYSLANNMSDVVCKEVGASDGDTIKCLKDDKNRLKIRLDQIDALENKQSFGKQSKQSLSSFIDDKKRAFKVSGKDRYGRTIAKIYDSQGRNIILKMVQAGMAWMFLEYSQSTTYLQTSCTEKCKAEHKWIVGG